MYSYECVYSYECARTLSDMPYSLTIASATCVATERSLAAPVVARSGPYTISSAARPPIHESSCAYSHNAPYHHS